MNKLRFLSCPEKYRKQCLSKHSSYGCKLRFFNERCLYAIALKNKNKKEIEK